LAEVSTTNVLITDVTNGVTEPIPGTLDNGCLLPPCEARANRTGDTPGALMRVRSRLTYRSGQEKGSSGAAATTPRRGQTACRQTYEIFAGSWGSWADPGDSPIWTALNTKPKYVASTTLTGPRWANTTVLSGDLAAAIGELKAKPRGEMQVHGSGRLVRC
jgi:hypothetical protein